MDILSAASRTDMQRICQEEKGEGGKRRRTGRRATARLLVFLITRGCRFGANRIPSWNKNGVAIGPALYYIE